MVMIVDGDDITKYVDYRPMSTPRVQLDVSVVIKYNSSRGESVIDADINTVKDAVYIFDRRINKVAIAIITAVQQRVACVAVRYQLDVHAAINAV